MSSFDLCMKMAKTMRPIFQVNLYSLMLHHQRMPSSSVHVSSTTNEEPALPSQGTIHTDRKIYRPKLPSKYIDPDLGPDLLDGQEIIFKTYGRTIRRQVDELPPRNDIIQFDPSRHQAEFDRNIRWEDCP
jgi:hypothetical protein